MQPWANEHEIRNRPALPVAVWKAMCVVAVLFVFNSTGADAVLWFGIFVIWRIYFPALPRSGEGRCLQRGALALAEDLLDSFDGQ